MPDHDFIRQQTEIMGALKETGAYLKDHRAKTEEKTGELQSRLQAVEQALVSNKSEYQSTYSCNQNPVAAEFVSSDAFTGLKSGMPTSGRQSVDCGIRAALTNPGRGQVGDSDWTTKPSRMDGLQGFAQPRLTLLDALTTQKVDTGVLEYVEISGYVNAANYQEKEGDEKAGADLPVALRRAEVATIAHYMPCSLQVLEDNSGLSSKISQVLSVGLRQKLEQELLVGQGGEGKIKGLIAHAQSFNGVGDNAADQIGQAITDLESDGWIASFIVMNPDDWFVIASERDSAGQYILGSPRDPAPPSLWNRPVILNPNMPMRGALVVDGGQVALLDRQQVTVEASRFDGSNFRKNMVTILSELRAGLAVYAPSALRLVEIN